MAISSLDTSIVIRILTDDLPEKRKQALELLSQPDHLFRLEDLAISEIIYVLTTVYEYSREDAINRLNLFLTRYSSNLIYSQTFFNTVFPFYLAHPKLSFNDCCLAAYAEMNHAEPLFTFDQKLAAQSPSAKLA